MTGCGYIDDVLFNILKIKYTCSREIWTDCVVDVLLIAYTCYILCVHISLDTIYLSGECRRIILCTFKLYVLLNLPCMITVALYCWNAKLHLVNIKSTIAVH